MVFFSKSKYHSKVSNTIQIFDIMAESPLRKKPKKSSTASTKHNTCAVCSDSDVGVNRQCELCRNSMHHFCSHDVAKMVTFRGQTLDDFEDHCFCSVTCWATMNQLCPGKDYTIAALPQPPLGLKTIPSAHAQAALHSQYHPAFESSSGSFWFSIYFKIF